MRKIDISLVMCAFLVLGGLAFSTTQPGTVARASAPISKGISANTSIHQRHQMGFIVVTPEGPRDGGDFGPYTPGTKTSGIQEAIDYAKKHRRDVYISGGAMPKAFTSGAVYRLDTTLHIPWMQDFRLDGGEALIYYRQTTGDAVVFDSQMSCRYKFGLIASRSSGAVVHFLPQTRGPDHFSVMNTSKFEFNALVGGGGAWPAKGKGTGAKLDVAQSRFQPKEPHHQWVGTGLFLDASHGTVDSIDIWVGEVVGCNKGIYVGPGCANTFIRCPFIHLCNTHVQVGDAHGPVTNGNRIEATIDSEGIRGSIGADIFGEDNLLTLLVRQTAPGKSVVFESTARDNRVIALQLNGGCTNNAADPTNRIISARPVGFNVVTPPFPASGQEIVNRNPFPVDVIILTPGQVSGWAQTDANGLSQAVVAGLSAGQTFVLEPGDKVRFAFAAPPAWKWKALQ